MSWDGVWEGIITPQKLSYGLGVAGLMFVLTKFVSGTSGTSHLINRFGWSGGPSLIREVYWSVVPKQETVEVWRPISTYAAARDSFPRILTQSKVLVWDTLAYLPRCAGTRRARPMWQEIVSPVSFY